MHKRVHNRLHYYLIRNSPILQPLQPNRTKRSNYRIRFRMFKMIQLIIKVIPRTLHLDMNLSSHSLLFTTANRPRMIRNLIISQRSHRHQTMLKTRITSHNTINRQCHDSTFAMRLRRLTSSTILSRRLNSNRGRINHHHPNKRQSNRFRTSRPQSRRTSQLTRRNHLNFSTPSPPTRRTRSISRHNIKVYTRTNIQMNLTITSRRSPNRIFSIRLISSTNTQQRSARLIRHALPPPRRLMTLRITLMLRYRIRLRHLNTARVINSSAIISSRFNQYRQISPIKIPARLNRHLTRNNRVRSAQRANRILRSRPNQYRLSLLTKNNANVPHHRQTSLLDHSINTILNTRRILRRCPVNMKRIRLTRHIRPRSLRQLLPRLRLQLNARAIRTNRTHLPSLVQ